MGLLDKLNPKATPRSALRWAIGWGVFGALFGLFGWYQSNLPNIAIFILIPWMAFVGGIAGWFVEWQTPWDLDEDDELNSE